MINLTMTDIDNLARKSKKILDTPTKAVVALCENGLPVFTHLNSNELHRLLELDGAKMETWESFAQTADLEGYEPSDDGGVWNYRKLEDSR